MSRMEALKAFYSDIEKGEIEKAKKEFDEFTSKRWEQVIEAREKGEFVILD